jgi:hypothetical protein
MNPRLGLDAGVSAGRMIPNGFSRGLLVGVYHQRPTKNGLKVLRITIVWVYLMTIPLIYSSFLCSRSVCPLSQIFPAVFSKFRLAKHLH